MFLQKHHLLIGTIWVLVLICQFTMVLGKLKIVSLVEDSFCQQDVNAEGMVTVYGNSLMSCDLQIKSSSMSGIGILITAGKITDTEYVYVERMEPVVACSNQYIAFMGLLQQPCKAYFAKESVILHLRGDIAVGIHEVIHNVTSFRCLEDYIYNQNEVDVLEDRTSNCMQLKGFSSVIHCSSNKRWWQVSADRSEKELSAIFNVKSLDCRYTCSHCIFRDRHFVYNCDKSIYEQNNISLVVFPPYISHLDLSQNYLSGLMADTFSTIGKNITCLDLNGNKLTKIEKGTFDYLHHLIHLDVNSNYLTTLNADCFHNLNNLTVLLVRKNRLASLHVQLFRDLHNLVYLDMEGDRLAETTPGFHDYEQLLEKLEPDQFANTGKLILLRLHYNALTTLQVGVFGNLSHLRQLWLQENQLTVLQVGLFDSLKNLEYLILSNNSLMTLELGLFDNLTRLTDLWMDDNSLVSIEVGMFDHLSNLQNLRLDSNALVALDKEVFATLHKLDTLNLTANLLTALDVELFANLHSPTSLTLQNNYLFTLNFNTFPNWNKLRHLYLNHNNIRYLIDGTFANLTNLQRLSIAHNKLTYLPFHLFSDLRSLQILSMEHNKLMSIPQINHMTSLSHINLVGNPLSKINKNITIRPYVFVDKYEVCACYFNASDKCYNQLKPSPYYTCNRLLSLPVLTIFIWIIGCSALLGNAFVLWWKSFKQKTENKVQSLLLSNLAMSDLLMGIYMIFIASADVYYGEYFPVNAEQWRTSNMCRIAGTLAITSSEASVFFVTLISIDRFITIRFPYSMRKLGVKLTRLISSFVWIFALFLGLVASFLAGRNPAFYDNTHVCIGLPLAQKQILETERKQRDRNYGGSIATNFGWDLEQYHYVPKKIREEPGLYFSIAIFIGLNMFCFLLILICYIEIIRVVYQSTKQSSRKREMSEEIRMTTKVSAIILTDFFCWFPICLLSALRQGGVVSAFPPDVFAWMVTFVLPINSAINPFLYTIGTVISEKCSRPISRQKYDATNTGPRLSKDTSTKSTSVLSQGMRKCSKQSSSGECVAMETRPRGFKSVYINDVRVTSISLGIREEREHVAPLAEKEEYTDV